MDTNKRNIITDFEHVARNLGAALNYPSRRLGLSNGYECEWSPKVDITEDETSYYLKTDIPGVDRDSLRVTYNKGQLTISGERKFEKKEGDGKTYHRVERIYGSFRRAFILPEDANPDSVEASVKDGMLNISIPKQEKAKPKEVNIKVE